MLAKTKQIPRKISKKKFFLDHKKHKTKLMEGSGLPKENSCSTTTKTNTKTSELISYPKTCCDFVKKNLANLCHNFVLNCDRKRVKKNLKGFNNLGKFR